MAAASSAEARRRVVAEVERRLAQIDGVWADASTLNIRVFLRPDGTPRAVVVTPELRYESTSG